MRVGHHGDRKLLELNRPNDADICRGEYREQRGRDVLRVGQFYEFKWKETTAHLKAP